MILQVKLAHLKIKNQVQHVQLWDIDAREIAAIAQSQGQRGVNGLVSEIIKKRLPTHFYNYEPVDWEFLDHVNATAA
jgi:hypothetical protein